MREYFCRSCRKHWTGEDQSDANCQVIQGLDRKGNGVYYCADYCSMAIIETEDDGTKRCSVCGKLWTGWSVCPACGARCAEKSAQRTPEAQEAVEKIVRELFEPKGKEE